jgi:hypothetical protein
MCPGGTNSERTFTTTTWTPSPESSPTAVGVTIPATFGRTSMVDGHGTVLVVTDPLAEVEKVDAW